MKSPPRTGSSGSSTVSTDSKSPTRSGINKSPTRPKKTRNIIQVPQRKTIKKWQALLHNARDVSADEETVKVLLFSGTEEGISTKEAEEEENSTTDASEPSEYDIKGLMAQIYHDLHTIAAIQASKSVSGKLVIGEPIENLLLREASIGVKIAISKSLQPSP